MKIRASLEGDEGSFEVLAELFKRGTTTRIEHEGDTWYLASSEFGDSVDDPTDLYGIALARLRRMNGVARAFHYGFAPVKLTGSFADEDGRVSVVVNVPAIEIKTYIHGPDESGSAYKYVELIRGDDDLDDAVRLLGTANPDLDWGDLYKIHEVVQHNVIGRAILKRQPWKKQSSAFTGSANNPLVSGEDARHARPPGGGGVPKDTMDLREARKFISDLVKELLNGWVAQSSSS